MTFSPTLLERIKENLLTSQVVSLGVVLKKKGKEYMGLCPFHTEKTPSFTVNDEKGFYHCFGCGAHGNVYDFLQHQENLSFPEAVERAAQMANISIAPQEHYRADPEKDRIEATFKDIVREAHEWFCASLKTSKGQVAREYLHNRGFTDAQMSTYGLGYAPDYGIQAHLMAKGYTIDALTTVGLVSHRDDGKLVDKFRHRIMFPIHNRRGDPVAFGGRRLGEFGPKYLNSPDTPLFHKGHILYNFVHARALKEKTQLLVVEGYMDVLALASQGYKSVAPMGTAVTEEQIKLMWQIDAAPIFLFDGDEGGQRATVRTMERFLPLLKPGHTCFFVTMPTGEDPDSFMRTKGPKAFQKLLDSKKPLITSLWDYVASSPAATPEERALLERKCQELLQMIDDKSIRYHYQQDVRAKLQQYFYGRVRPAHFKKPKPNKTVLQKQPPESALLYCLISYPDLWPYVQGPFSHLIFKSDSMGALHESMTTYFFADNPLEKEALVAYLSEYGHAEALEGLKDFDQTLHGQFLKRPGVTIDIRVSYWEDVHQIIYQKDLLVDQNEARQYFLDNMSSENWERYKALKSLSAQDEE